MSQKESSKTNQWLTLVGLVGAILIFTVILYLAYLPGRPAPVDTEVAEKRRQAADEARAAGLAKISELEVVDGDAGVVRIPIKDAMALTVEEYRAPKAIGN